VVVVVMMAAMMAAMGSSNAIMTDTAGSTVTVTVTVLLSEQRLGGCGGVGIATTCPTIGSPWTCRTTSRCAGGHGDGQSAS